MKPKDELRLRNLPRYIIGGADFHLWRDDKPDLTAHQPVTNETYVKWSDLEPAIRLAEAELRRAEAIAEMNVKALAAAPAPPSQEPARCTCDEADGMAVYSEDCPNEYHRERAVRAVFKSPRPATPQQESAKQNESRSPDGDGPHIFQDDLETGQCLVCGKAGGVHEPPAKRQQRTQP